MQYLNYTMIFITNEKNQPRRTGQSRKGDFHNANTAPKAAYIVIVKGSQSPLFGKTGLFQPCPPFNYDNHDKMWYVVKLLNICAKKVHKRRWLSGYG